MINNLPLTRIKITIAHFLYKLIYPFLFNKGLPKIKKRHGITYELDVREGLDLSMFIFGKFQPHTINSPLLQIPKDATILDVGGNFGFMALQYAQKVPEGRVISFEPTHYALAKFKRNLKLNPELSKRITVINSFVSAEVSIDPKIKAFSSWRVDNLNVDENTRHSWHLGIEKSTEGVGAVTLDSFCEINKINKVDLIKIDTEGHEAEVLKGARETMANHLPFVIFEVGQYVMVEKGIDFTFYHDYFSKLSYKLFNSRSKKSISLSNWKSEIPEFGTIDIIAIPPASR
jgi:FkbM family methyltransferase